MKKEKIQNEKQTDETKQIYFSVEEINEDSFQKEVNTYLPEQKEESEAESKDLTAILFDKIQKGFFNLN